MHDPNGLRYTNEYMAQEYRNEAANLKYKLDKLHKENEGLKLEIEKLKKQVYELKNFYC